MKPSRPFTLYPKCVLGLFLALAATSPEIWAASTLPTISINDVTVSETACQSYNAVFTVSVSRLIANKVVTVQYATANGSAIAGTDYTAVSGTLTFQHDSAVEGPNGTYLLTITVPLGNIIPIGTNRIFLVNLSGAANATIVKAQGIGTIQPPAAALCDDGNSCTNDFCNPTVGCEHVDISTCSLPGNEADCKLSNVCNTGDADGDGLGDKWERSGGIDLNCDGVLTPDEMVLTNVDPVFPDGTLNTHPSADPAVKDVFVKYDWMELPDQLTNGEPTACTVNPLPSGPPDFLNLFYPYHSDQCDFDQACLNNVCKGHSDAPDPAALMMVIEEFARHNVRLHVVKGHALPHANVITYGTPITACVSDLSTQTFLGAHAADFYADYKAVNLNATYNGQTFDFAHLFPVFHYVIFAHRHSCDSTADCAQAACINPDTGRNPLFNETGVAEQPGNDIIVSMGGFRDRNITPLVLAQAGTFMHELGHNLGLNHGGPIFNAGVATDPNQVKINYKPNYLSVMNYNHQLLGISTASPNCAPGDYACKTTRVSTRVDFSSFFNGIVPNALDENNGSEAAGINLGNSDIGYTWCSGVQTGIPGTGAVDFNCNGLTNETWCASGCNITPGLELNKDPAGLGQIPNGTPGSGDVLVPFEDWPNLVFAYQCQGTFNDGAAPGTMLSSGEMTCDQMIAQAARQSSFRAFAPLTASLIPQGFSLAFAPMNRRITSRTPPAFAALKGSATSERSSGEGAYSLGREDAQLTLVEFSDYQCPFCRRFNAETFAELKKNYIDTGKLRFISRDLPLSFHSNAMRAAEAARCAGDQGKFWEMRDALVSNAADLSPAAILKYAQGVPLDMTSFGACMDGKKYDAGIEKDIADAHTLGITGTPSFVLGRTSKDTVEGIRLVGALPFDEFDAAIKRALAGGIQ